MTERPIIFSGPMVRAILAGRKTQTRRAITKPTVLDWLGAFLPEFVADKENGLSPYGYGGDRLWVRETTAIWPGQGLVYTADDDAAHYELRKRPAIHMPRADCRLVLEVTAVRIERLQDISEADAIAEGVERNCDGFAAHPDCPPCKAAGRCRAEGEFIDYTAGDEGFPAENARDSFRSLWDSINAERAPWVSNPWVWVVEFKRHQPQSKP